MKRIDNPYRLTDKQMNIVEYVDKYETMNVEDIADNKFSQNIIDRLVTNKVLEKQEDEDDYVFYDFTSEFYEYLNGIKSQLENLS